MMNYKILYLLLAIAFIGCNDDDIQDTVDNINAPQQVDATFKITQDNSGLVTITPTAQNASRFQIFFGDGSEETVEVSQGESVQHLYTEGTYDVKVRAFALNGKVTDITKQLMVSFRAPENLEVTIVKDPNSSFGITVSANADFATLFQVSFGEDPNEEVQDLPVDGEISYVYDAIGTYTVTVTALSGGEATTVQTIEVQITDPLLLPINFESTTLPYDFFSFEGAAFAKAENPDTNGNNSANVGRVIKAEGAATFAGTIIELSQPIDFSERRKLKIATYVPSANSVVRVKLENSTDNSIFAEVDAVTTVANAWETLLFDFSDADLTQQYSKIIIFFDFGNEGMGDTFYFDNVDTTNQQLEALELPLTFESQTLEYVFTEFGGAPTMVVDNPQPNGINISSQVAQTVKESGAEPFAGAFIDLDRAVNFGNFDFLRLDVLSPKPGSVVNIKVENLDNADLNMEASTTTSANAGEWEELTFDFSGIDASVDYQRIVVFFDFLTDGVGDTYYFDNLRESNGTNPLQLPLTFEDDNLGYDFEGFDGGTVTIAPNPMQEGINTSNTVGEFLRAADAQNSAGSLIALDSPINFGSFSKVTMKTLSPIAGAVVKLKFENATEASISVEVDAMTTVVDEWEQLTFDFSGMDLTREYSKVVVFFDFGNDGNGSTVTYYFDDINLSN